VNRICKFLVPGLILAAGLVAPAMADLKVGVVNYGRLMQDSPQAKAAEDAIRAEFATRQSDMQRQQASLKAKEEKLQKDAATMSEAQRSQAEKDLRDGNRDLARKAQEMQDDFNARRNEEMTRLQRSLLEEVNAYGKAQGYDLVLAEGVIYATNSLDITPAILTALQSRKGGGAAKPAAK
jgi:outer membrane protein